MDLVRPVGSDVAGISAASSTPRPRSASGRDGGHGMPSGSTDLGTAYTRVRLRRRLRVIGSYSHGSAGLLHTLSRRAALSQFIRAMAAPFILETERGGQRPPSL